MISEAADEIVAALEVHEQRWGSLLLHRAESFAAWLASATESEQHAVYRFVELLFLEDKVFQCDSNEATCKRLGIPDEVFAGLRAVERAGVN